MFVTPPLEPSSRAGRKAFAFVFAPPWAREHHLDFPGDAEKGDSTEKGVTQGGDSQEESQADTLLCFVFGGMNTEGEIYDDCIVTAVD